MSACIALWKVLGPIAAVTGAYSRSLAATCAGPPGSGSVSASTRSSPPWCRHSASSCTEQSTCGWHVSTHTHADAEQVAVGGPTWWHRPCPCRDWPASPGRPLSEVWLWPAPWCWVGHRTLCWLLPPSYWSSRSGWCDRWASEEQTWEQLRLGVCNCGSGATRGPQCLWPKPRRRVIFRFKLKTCFTRQGICRF